MRPYLPIAALALAIATPANATILVTGSNALPGTTNAAEPNLAGIVVQDVLDAFSITDGNGTFSGTVQSRVVQSVDGTYDFYWRIRDTSFAPSGPNAVAITLGSFRIGAFGVPIAGLNGNFRTDGLGSVGPDSAFVFSGGFDQYVNFAFSNGIAAGTDSYFMFLDTNATSYSRTAFMDLATPGFNPISNSLTTFGPGAVPEPATWAMMLTGFGFVGGAMRRRSKVAVSYA